MLEGKIEFAGRTLSDALSAIEAAKESIENENTGGFNRNADSDYSFEITGEEDGTYSYGPGGEEGPSAKTRSDELLRLIRLTVRQMRVDEHPDIRKAHADEIAEYFEALDKLLGGGGELPTDWSGR